MSKDGHMEVEEASDTSFVNRNFSLKGGASTWTEPNSTKHRPNRKNGNGDRDKKKTQRDTARDKSLASDLRSTCKASSMLSHGAKEETESNEERTQRV